MMQGKEIDITMKYFIDLAPKLESLENKNVFQGKFDCVIIELIDGVVTNKMLLVSICSYSFYFK